MIDLTARLASEKILVAPGVYDPLSAMIAEQAGAEAVFVSGAMVAMAQYGLPDFGLGTASELVDLVARIVDRVGVPALVDGDQGFGNAAHVQRFVRALARAGAAAVQIEDQVAVKPVSMLGSRPLVPIAEMVGKLKAALDARPSDAFLISARTDALSTTDLNDALERAEAYVVAGCDLLFVEGVRTRMQADAIVAHFGARIPLVHNLLESGGSPYGDAAEAEKAGFALAFFPASGLGAAADGLRAAYAAIVRDGGTQTLRARMSSFSELNDIVGTAAFSERLAHYGDPQ